MQVFVKREEETDEKFGKRQQNRSVEELIEFGVINLDKPPGPTSHQVSDYVQRILKIEKAGHGGSLDPNVTGVLPITLERATRLSQVLLKGGKEYVCIMHLHKAVDEAEIRKAINDFIGKITQMPPVKSAVKRVLRERTVYSFEIFEIEGKDVLFRVSCEAGTYIRKLCFDIGKKLGVGANMAELRRVRAGHFTEEDIVTLQDVKDAFVLWKQGNERFMRHCIKPAERMVEHLPKVWVFDSAVESICHGRDVAIPGVSKLTLFEKEDAVAVMTLKDELVALGVAGLGSSDVLSKEKGIAVKVNKVFMKEGVYAS
ncbi:RNA-guided pseudouridylation complex pseudouridine synthase subunit Cbf5 [Candidatus Woesearchaeota archaeon]|nr:RNA-guided pseudouridylation complex pseudouridine synthase subunit Cbf5 [Candidatus Woesearchaeota archaeon]